jgi:hypothetical protein
LFGLLATQLLHLLTRPAIAARNLSSQLGHLSLTRLFVRDIRRL